MEGRIRKAIEEALESIGAQGVSFVVERPTDSAHGDYATNAALAAAKQLGKNPRSLADELARHLIDSLGDSVASHVSVAGPGFVNITLSREAVTLAVAEAAAPSFAPATQGASEGHSRDPNWGKGAAQKARRVIVEYTDPNPFKEMHIGHLMSNVIGESLARLTESEGAAVVRANYQGDVGPHVAKAIWGLRKAGITEPSTAQELGEAYAAGSRAYEESPGAKAEIDELNQDIYKGTDAALMEEWRKGRDVSLAAFEQLYKMLGTHFDYYFFESETAESGTRIVRDGLNKGIFEESEGAIIYRGEKKGLHTLVFITSRGTPTYEAKDIGLAFLKEERVQTDRSIIVTAAEQIGHFKVFLAALSEMAPTIAASGLIDDIIKKALVKNNDPLVAEQVALGAIKYMVLRQAPGSDIVFDPDKSLSLDGDSGPYLQYALVRAKKILTYASEGETGAGVPHAPYAIERLIVHFPEVVVRAARELAPNILTTYLTALAAEWNHFYATEQVLGSPEEAYKQRVARAFANTMTNGLALLGIPAPERM